MSLRFKQRASSTTKARYSHLYNVEKKKQQNLGNAILLENSWTPLLQNPMVRSAYKLPAWKPNRNSHITAAILLWFPNPAPSDALHFSRTQFLCSGLLRLRQFCQGHSVCALTLIWLLGLGFTLSAILLGNSWTPSFKPLGNIWRFLNTGLECTPIYTYKVCVVVEQKTATSGNAILLENSRTPLLQHQMVRSAYKLPAWKPNRNSLMTPAVAEMVDAKVPP